MIVPQGDILEDLPLIQNLEETKATSTYVVEKVKQAKDTEVRLPGRTYLPRYHSQTALVQTAAALGQ